MIILNIIYQNTQVELINICLSDFDYEDGYIHRSDSYESNLNKYQFNVDVLCDIGYKNETQEDETQENNCANIFQENNCYQQDGCHWNDIYKTCFYHADVTPCDYHNQPYTMDNCTPDMDATCADIPEEDLLNFQILQILIIIISKNLI